MNENTLIKKISRLREVNISQERSISMKKRLLREIEEENLESPRQKSQIFTRTPLTIAFFVILLVLLGIFSTNMFQYTIRPLITTTRIALAPNHYQKARVAFADAQMQLQQLNNHEQTSPEESMKITAVTNQYVTELHLNGEKGKYTQDQCQQLHKEYQAYLSTLKQILLKRNQKEYARTVGQLQRVIQTRLSFYQS